MKAQHDEYNLILVSDELSPVRRYRLTKKRIKLVVGAVAALALVLAAGVADYVRLRMDAVDVDQLRAQTAEQESELTLLASQVGELSSEFGTLRELERKVRVIANLPGAVDEARVPEVLDGRGGYSDAGDPEETAGHDDPAPTQPGPAKAAPTREAAPVPMPLSQVETRSGEFDVRAVRHARERASRLARQITPGQESFEALLEGLEGKHDQLASTPSIWPTDGWVTSRYGSRTSPFTGKKQFHGGIDIAAAFGTQVIAPARGKVTFAGKKGPLGNTVVIDHGYGLRTTYAHNAKLYVKRGEQVERGTPIATVGSTGRSTGPHLHYAINVSGRSVDPANYIFE